MIARVLHPPPSRTFADATEFLNAWFEDASSLPGPVDRAIAGGALADRLGYAFAAGYTAALEALFSSLDACTVASLAATEEGGAHPRAIHTRLERSGSGWTLTGHKQWVTLAGSELFVLARRGEGADGRAQLVVVRVPREREGVRVVPLPEMPFVPEVLHAELHFDQVRVAENELLPGDGWERWVKPFRTVEDVHVHAAVLAWLGATGVRAGWPKELLERALAQLVSLRALAGEDPSSPLTHLAVAGAIVESRRLFADCEPHWVHCPPEQRERWTRDRPLLEVAERARAARTRRAWERVGQG